MIGLTAMYCPAHAPISCLIEEHLGKWPGTSWFLQKRHSRSSLWLPAPSRAPETQAGRGLKVTYLAAPPLPRNTFPEGSSSPLSQSVQMCAHHIPGSCVVPPGKISKSPKTKPFSRSLLKSNLQENKRDESQKSQAQVESMELLRFQPPLPILSTVAQFTGELCVSRPPHCSCSISLVAVSVGAYAQPSHSQEKPPRHHLSWPHHLQDITFQRNSGKKLTCNEVCSH